MSSGMWECPNCGRRIRDDWDSCPHCHTPKNETSNSQIEIPEYLVRHEQPTHARELYAVKPANSVGDSSAAKFLKIIGWLMIILGIVVAWKAGNVEEIYESYYGYRTDTTFDFWTFLITYIPYLIGGALSFCASELFENIKRIADSLSKMEIVKK